jgi:hypothetical protein
MNRLLILVISTALIAGPSTALAMYVYPAKGQSQKQQDLDTAECHRWAVEQSGYDPARAQGYQAQGPGVVGGAARGAAVGAVGGAIGGDAGKGAAVGAAAGGMMGGMRRRRGRREQEQRQAYGADQYTRAMTACLQARGYSVQ